MIYCFLEKYISSIVYILSCLKTIGNPKYVSYTVKKDMHTVRKYLMCFKKAYGKLLIKQCLGKHFNHTRINNHVFIISLSQLLSSQVKSNSLFSQFYIGKQHEIYIHKFVKHLIVVLNMKFV